MSFNISARNHERLTEPSQVRRRKTSVDGLETALSLARNMSQIQTHSLISKEDTSTMCSAVCVEFRATMDQLTMHHQ